MAELVWRGKQRTDHGDGGEGQQRNENSHPKYVLQTVESYLPEQSNEIAKGQWCNRLLLGERAVVLSTLQEEFAEKIDLIYIDPPFMTGRTFTQGTQIAYRDIWNNDLDSYLQWLYDTFHLLYRLLARDGSLYVHLDWRASHYAKVLLDEIFGGISPSGGKGFRNEIIWHYQSGGRASKHYARKHDTLLLYTRSQDYCFHPERISERRGRQRRNHMRKEVDPDGRIRWSIRTGGRVYTYDEDSPISLADVWSDISHLQQKDPERTGYATQKPAALLERILLASSEEQDLVLDCFCGSGVTAVVAEQLDRRWICSDQSELAIATTKQRLHSLSQQHPFILQHPRNLG